MATRLQSPTKRRWWSINLKLRPGKIRSMLLVLPQFPMLPRESKSPR